MRQLIVAIWVMALAGCVTRTQVDVARDHDTNAQLYLECIARKAKDPSVDCSAYRATLAVPVEENR